MIISQNHRYFRQIRPLSMNSRVDHFDHFSKNSQKTKKITKNEILRHGVLLYLLVARKNNKFDFLLTFQKIATQKGLSSINMHRFQAKRP